LFASQGHELLEMALEGRLAPKGGRRWKRGTRRSSGNTRNALAAECWPQRPIPDVDCRGAFLARTALPISDSVEPKYDSEWIVGKPSLIAEAVRPITVATSGSVCA